MTAKEYLRQAYRLKELIDSDLSELERLRSLLTSVSSTNLSGVLSGGAGSTEPAFAKCIQKIIDLEKEVDEEIDRFVDLEKEIRGVINGVENPNERLLLRLRYTDFLAWERIAEQMSYSVMQVHRIHAAALRNVKIPKN